jgi:hypothetical protein
MNAENRIGSRGFRASFPDNDEETAETRQVEKAGA